MAAESTNWSQFFDWTYAGVDHSLPGNGGQVCVDFLGPGQRILESIITSLFALMVIWYTYPHLTLPAEQPKILKENETTGKRILLVLMCLTWGCELGFKFATRQMIWVFNPCHIATAIQIYLLAAAPSRVVTAAFRLHMHMLTGAPIAILFPVINTRLLPFETEVYYIQHILMLVVPFYLMHLGDPYIPESLSNFSWAAMTGASLFIYHFIPLQILALASQVNLNNMLCPAVSDPFHGPYYRLFAVGHQMILIPSLGKMYAALARRLGWCLQEQESSVSDLLSEESKSSKEIVAVAENVCPEDVPDGLQECCGLNADFHSGHEHLTSHVLKNRQANGSSGSRANVKNFDIDGSALKNGHLKEH